MEPGDLVSTEDLATQAARCHSGCAWLHGLLLAECLLCRIKFHQEVEETLGLSPDWLLTLIKII